MKGNTMPELIASKYIARDELSRKEFGTLFDPFSEDAQIPGGNDWKV